MAEIIIKGESVLYLDASDPTKVETETINGEKYVSTWQSDINKNGRQFGLSQQVTIPIELHYNETTGEIVFNGANHIHGLSNSDFNELANKTSFTRVFVYTPNHTSGTNRMMYYDGQTNYDVYMYTTNYFYVKASTLNSTTQGIYGTITPTVFNNSLNNNHLLQTTIFDSSKDTNAERLKVSFYGNDVEFTSHNGNSTDAKTERLWNRYPAIKQEVMHLKEMSSKILLFDKAIDNEKLSRIHFYLRKKANLGSRCSLPNDLTGFSISPKYNESTNDELYFSDQVDVTCFNGATPIVECGATNNDPLEITCN